MAPHRRPCPSPIGHDVYSTALNCYALELSSVMSGPKFLVIDFSCAFVEMFDEAEFCAHYHVTKGSSPSSRHDCSEIERLRTLVEAYGCIFGADRAQALRRIGEQSRLAQARVHHAGNAHQLQ